MIDRSAGYTFMLDCDRALPFVLDDILAHMGDKVGMF
jgi:hypothetical protein